MGMIATAVSSLCAEPPSLLVCVNQSASMHEALTHAPTFAVNILHASELDTAHLFVDVARKHLRFEDLRWVIAADAPPVLSTAQAVLLCDLAGAPVFGTHSICVGVVRDARSRADIDPLIYLDGKFATAPSPS